MRSLDRDLAPCLYFVSTNDFAHDLQNFVEYTGKGRQLESLHNYLTNLKMQFNLKIYESLSLSTWA